MPTVSVIVPTYNRADVLSRTIDSVLEQTFEDLELIVVDDASTDETESVVRSYEDPRITYRCHETNRGGSAARNTGIECAEGEYVAFLDSDDAWLPTKVERQVTLLESKPDDWVAAYCGVQTVFPDDRSALWDLFTATISRREKTEGAEGGSELIKDVLSDDLHTSAGSTLIVRTDVVEAIDGFDESFERFQDPEFLIRVLQRGKLAFVDDPLVHRYASDDPPADAVRRADEHYLETFSEIVDRLESRGCDITGAHHYMLAKLYLREGRFVHGVRYLLTARSPEPRQYPGLLLSIYRGVRENVAGAGGTGVR